MNKSELNDSNMGAAGTLGQEQISVSSFKPKLPKFKGQGGPYTMRVILGLL